MGTYDIPSVYDSDKEEGGEKEDAVHELKDATRAAGFVQEPMLGISSGI